MNSFSDLIADIDNGTWLASVPSQVAIFYSGTPPENSAAYALTDKGTPFGNWHTAENYFLSNPTKFYWISGTPIGQAIENLRDNDKFLTWAGYDPELAKSLENQAWAEASKNTLNKQAATLSLSSTAPS